MKKQLISKEELKSRWGNFVLFTEKADNDIALKKAKNRITWPLPFIFLSFFLTLFPYEEMCFVHGFFFLFPVLGLMFSIAAFKDLLGTNSGIINALCNISASTSCLAIMESKKWKIFDIINLSDLSVVFFSYQSLAFTAAFISNSISEFMYIQKILLLATIPVITISLYYQKMVEKNGVQFVSQLLV